MQRLLWSCLKPPAGFAEQEKKLYWRLDCCSEWLHSLYLWLVVCDLYSLCRMNRLQLFYYQQVTSRSWKNSTCLLSLVEVFYFRTNSCGVLVVCLFCFVLFCFFFRWNCIFYSILELKRFSSGANSSFAKKNFSSSFQFWTDANIDRIWRAWYNGSYTMMAEPIKTLELHYPVFQFLIIYNVLRDNIRETYIWSFYCSYSSLTFFI